MGQISLTRATIAIKLCRICFMVSNTNYLENYGEWIDQNYNKTHTVQTKVRFPNSFRELSIVGDFTVI